MSRIIMRAGKVSPLGVNCPGCGAVAGKSCQTSSGKRLHGTHQGRKDVVEYNAHERDLVAHDTETEGSPARADEASDALADTAANNKQLHWTS